MANQRRIVMIGRTGSGKSATGNTILGNDAFESRPSIASVTSKSKFGRASRFDRDVNIIDTPGLFDTNMPNKVVITEITKCIGMTSPGPHAFLLVLPVGRFTQEELDTVKEFQNYFGEEMLRHLIVLFTRTDDLQGLPMDNYMQTAPEGLSDLLRGNNNRYIGFNNRATPSDKDGQVRQLLDMIDHMVQENGGSYYSNEMYEEAEKAMRRHEENIRRELQNQRGKEQRDVERQFATQMERQQQEYNEIVGQMRTQIALLESDKRESAANDISELRKIIQEMRREGEMEMQRNWEESIRRTREMESRLCDLERDIRTVAIKDVEAENSNSLGLLWEGLKMIGKGFFRIIF